VARFGYELRERRKAERLSARALGRLVQVSDDMILSIEKGKYPSCQRELAQRLDEALGTGGLFDRAWPMAFGRRDADKKRTDADKRASGTGEGAVPVRTSRILGNEPSPRPGSPEPVYRRSFFQLSGLAALAPIDLTLAFAPAEQTLPQSISASHIDQVQEVATAISGWDNRFGGGGMVRDVASRAMQWAAGLLQAQSPEHLRADLFASVSRLGVVVGASAFDAYAHDEATRAFRFGCSSCEGSVLIMP
jgi:transcriptional regulator with XRE-family HTH domain